MPPHPRRQELSHSPSQTPQIIQNYDSFSNQAIPLPATYLTIHYSLINKTIQDLQASNMKVLADVGYRLMAAER
jgi:hypothetical protein